MESEFLSMCKTVVRDTVQSIRRNSLMSLASVISIIAALLILGIFTVLTINIQEMTASVESQLEIKVFLAQDATSEQKMELQELFEGNPKIESVGFETKDEALEEFSGTLTSNTTLLDMFDSQNNPLPESFVVKVTDAENLEVVKDEIEGYSDKGIEYIKYGQDYITALLNFSRFVDTLSIVVLVVLTIISLLLIYNTIRLTVFARRKEIGIMKYVGATDHYIRMPFILEGMILGIIAALVAILIIRGSYFYVLGYINSSVLLSLSKALASPEYVLVRLGFFFVLYGLIVGAIGSFIAIRKFLDV